MLLCSLPNGQLKLQKSKNSFKNVIGEKVVKGKERGGRGMKRGEIIR